MEDSLRRICVPTKIHNVDKHTHTHHLRLDQTVFTLVWFLACWKCVDEQVDHALYLCVTPSATVSAHHQTAEGSFTCSAAATSEETMGKCFTLWLRLPSKLAKWVWGSGVAVLFPSRCAVSYGSILGLHKGSLGSTVAWTTRNSC